MGQIIKVSGFKAYPFQQQYLNHPARFIAVEGATKIGKTFPFAYMLTKHAFSGLSTEKRHQERMWVGPTTTQAEIAYKRMSRVYRNNDEFELIGSKGVQRITRLTNGSTINFRSADKPDSLYGFENQEVYCDEITRWKPESLSAVFSTVEATQGKVYMFGNFTGATSWFHRMIERQLEAQNPEWAYFRVPFTEAVKAGLRTQEQLDAAQQNYDELTYKRLYLCEDIRDDNRSFAYAFNSQTHVDATIDYDPTAALWLSFDFNIDPMSCVIGQRVSEDQFNFLDEIELQNSDIALVTDRIKAKYPKYRYLVTGDASGTNRSGMVRGKLTYWLSLTKELRLNNMQIKKRGKNLGLIDSRVIVNSAFQNKTIRIHPRCKSTIRQLNDAIVDETGALVKDRKLHKNDLLDCVRYMLDANFPNILAYQPTND
jgi:hypothetical protein